MAESRLAEVVIGTGARIAAGVAAAVVALAAVLYAVWPRTVTTVVSGCTPSEEVECVAEVTAEPESAIVIAALVVAVYLGVIALSGRVPTLKIGDNEISLPGTAAGEGSPEEAASGEQVRALVSTGLEGVPTAATESRLLYEALPDDVRRAAEALWTVWGESDLAGRIVGVTRERGPGRRPFFITATTSGGVERVLRITPPGTTPPGDAVVVVR